MSYTKHYTGTKTQRMEQARIDAREYLGLARYRELSKAIRNLYEAHGSRGLAKWYPFYTSMAGLHGAPARAIALTALRYATKRAKAHL
jgi:hypothetical protein